MGIKCRLSTVDKAEDNPALNTKASDVISLVNMPEFPSVYIPAGYAQYIQFSIYANFDLAFYNKSCANFIHI